MVVWVGFKLLFWWWLGGRVFFVDGGGGGLWGWWLSFFFGKMGLILGWVLIVVMVAIFLGVILVVKNWCLWLSFGGILGVWVLLEKQRKRKEREKRRERVELFILFNVVVYIILISCI